MHRHLSVCVRLPDRPGSLGAVASRLGAIGADITAVTIASRHGPIAEDVFHLDLADGGDVDVVALLRRELGEVDGVEVVSVDEHPGCGCRGHEG